MQKPLNKTKTMFFFKNEEDFFKHIVPLNHAFRKLNQIIDFEKLARPFNKAYSHTGSPGINSIKTLKALIIQFWEDYSDREIEKAIKENMAVRWFCEFSLNESTPNFSYFSKFRKRIGIKKIEKIFYQINRILEQHGLFSNLFTFIDSSTIITKTALWKERDKAIKKGEKKLNNLNVNKYSANKEAK